ncbi:MAG: hypothetical protein ACOC4C_00645 [Fibrobacterota bacterium]
MIGVKARPTGLILLLSSILFAQNIEDAQIDSIDLNFDATVSMGFNYDFLRSATDVSFDYPVGYIGLNIPFKYQVNEQYAEDVTEGLEQQMPNIGHFKPTASAQQYSNTTVRVDVPMLGGVGTFANIQNFFFDYNNTLGSPDVNAAFENDTLNMFLRGILSVPFDMNMGWETMVFGYAYKVNELFKFALNLNRHTFRFDMNARINSDILGYLNIDIPAPEGEAEDLGQDIGFKDSVSVSYNSERVYGAAHGHYDLEAWTPTIGLGVWRFGLTSRFGMKAKAGGTFTAKYALPFFVDPVTMQLDEFDEAYLMDNMGRFLKSDTNGVTYGTESDLKWQMPHGHTLTLDIIRDKLYVSYTKFFGEIVMGLDNIGIMHRSENASSDSTFETVDLEATVSVDHILMLHGSFHNAFFNIGVFSMNASYMDQKDLLTKAVPELAFADGIMIPVLNFGTALGSKIQLLLELDLLPLAALKTGLKYYF